MSIIIHSHQVYGTEAAIRGMRNPMESWDNSDSMHCDSSDDGCYLCMDCRMECDSTDFYIGPKDHELCMRLIKGGSDHAKFRRMINVSMDICAPLYWWKEFDTYKVGTVANSCSTMHKLGSRELSIEDFAHDELMPNTMSILKNLIEVINDLLKKWKETGYKGYWKQAIQLLPSSLMQKRTVQLNYEVLANICKRRINHKLTEWQDFCDYCSEVLPWSEFFMPADDAKKED